MKNENYKRVTILTDLRRHKQNFTEVINKSIGFVLASHDVKMDSISIGNGFVRVELKQWFDEVEDRQRITEFLEKSLISESFKVEVTWLCDMQGSEDITNEFFIHSVTRRFTKVLWFDENAKMCTTYFKTNEDFENHMDNLKHSDLWCLYDWEDIDEEEYEKSLRINIITDYLKEQFELYEYEVIETKGNIITIRDMQQDDVAPISKTVDDWTKDFVEQEEHRKHMRNS